MRATATEEIPRRLRAGWFKVKDRGLYEREAWRFQRVSTNHRPTGERGLNAYWRNGSKLIDANACRVLLGMA